ncbi:hypothetical protein SteCoe_14931 [Stentor coeruleus]|uniref:Uncharacterized protein n=1 Tax=Stentor coeruleus TaxID=5963 RepID=A0A1R2C4W1_9CILI|nr:hypothetical protein SteCoe_14931 [Stentor coeruleus]
MDPTMETKTFQLPSLVRKKLNEKARFLIRLIEKKRKKSVDLTISLSKAINEAFNELHSHFNKHIEILTSLIVSEPQNEEEYNAVIKVLSTNYLPDEDLIEECKISIKKTVNAYKIRKTPMTAVIDRTKENLKTDFGLIVDGQLDKFLALTQTPDQKYLVSSSSDNNITLWNYKQKYQETVLQGHSKPVNSLAISTDSKFIVSGSNDNTVKVWSLDDKDMYKMNFLHDNIVSSVAIAKDNSFIVSGCYDNKVYVWNTSSKELISPFVGHEDKVLCVAIDNTMEIIASGSKDNMIRIWKKNDRTFALVLLGHNSQVNCITFTPNNNYLISGSKDCTVRIWKYKENNHLIQLNGHTNSVLSVTTTNNSLYAISSSVDRTIRVWNMLTANQEKIFMQKGPVRSICISNDDKYLIATDNNLTICSYDLETKVLSWKIANHTTEIKKIVVNSDKSAVITMSQNEIIVWNAYTKEQEAVIDRFNSRCMNVSKDGLYLALGLENKGIYVWNLAEKLPHLETFDHDGVVNCISIASNNSFIVSGSSDNNVIQSDLYNFTKFTVFAGHTNQVLCVTISSDSQLIVSGSADKTVIVWNIFKKKSQAVFKDHKGVVTSVAITSSTQYIFSGSDDKLVIMWNLLEMKSERVFDNFFLPIKCLDLDNFSKIIAVGLKDSTIFFANIENFSVWYKRNFINEFKAHKGELVGFSFGQNSEMLISLSMDGSLKLWDVQKAKNISEYTVQNELNYGLAYDNKLSRVYLLSQYGGVMIFSAENLKLISFEKIFDKTLMKNVIIAYPEMKEFIRSEIGKEGIV